MRWFWPTVTAAMVLDGLNARKRLETMAVLERSDAPPAPGHRVIAAAGVHVDDATLRAASAHATARGLDVLDLVPGDLPVERLIAVARMVDPAATRTRPLASGHGALQAILVTDDVAARAGINTFAGLDDAAMGATTARLKKFAAHTTDIALAPTLHAALDASPLSAGPLTAFLPAPVVGAGLLGDVAMLAGAARSRRPWALAAVAARALHPMIAAGGLKAPIEPPDVADAIPRQLVSSARGLPTVLARRKGPAAGGSRRARKARGAADRERYDKLLADGIGRFVDPERTDCPVCGGTTLEERMVTSDLIQCKPGEFRLDECTSCGHIFQNPQLNLEGMDFYYADFYGGATEDVVERAFSVMGSFYRARAEAVRGVAAAPRRWLDVGGGHGHFCLSAKGTFPDTTFDALDMNDSIEEAERRGWTDRSYQGLFPDRAPELAGRYDVVSMFHYLEHARDLGAELDAAATALGPDGVVLIEIPDASSRVASLLGRFWWPWVQPQHLHFPSVEILTNLLAERGFEVVRVEEGSANVPFDFVVASMQFLNWAAPRTDVPWRPVPTPGAKAKRAAVLAAGWPLVLAGLATDLALRPLGGRANTSNSYRLVAKRLPHPAAVTTPA